MLVHVLGSGDDGTIIWSEHAETGLVVLTKVPVAADQDRPQSGLPLRETLSRSSYLSSGPR